MKRGTILQLCTLALLIWACFYVHSCAAGDPRNAVIRFSGITRPPLVQVGLTSCRRVEAARIRLPETCRIAGEFFGLEGELEVKVAPDGLSIGDHAFGLSRILIEPTGDTPLEVFTTDARGRKPRFRAYRGVLILLEDRGKVTVVNELDMERYLAGVVGAEMHLNRHEEALKAQVIAARTYAICELRSGRLRKVNGEHFDLFDDERSQAYGGKTAESAKTIRLVEETRGMFVTWKDQLVNTFYSSTCGGHSDSAWAMLGKGKRIPPLMGTACEWCRDAPLYEWTVELDGKEAARKLFKNETNLEVTGVRTLKTLPGGHVEKVEVTLKGHDKPRVMHGYREFRRRLGLKSSLFVKFEAKEGMILVTGRGFGHGVGMCQYGAYGMADAGKPAIEILEYYYPGAKVRKLY